MTAYFGNRNYLKSDTPIAVRLSSEGNLSLTHLAEILEDIDKIFAVASKEITSRIKRACNNRKQSGMIVARDFKSGSLEILADPYFQGIVSGVAVNLICSTFVYTMRRINGRPALPRESEITSPSPDVISDEKLKEAAKRTVETTTKTRQRLRQKITTFQLSISVNIEGRYQTVTDE